MRQKLPAVWLALLFLFLSGGSSHLSSLDTGNTASAAKSQLEYRPNRILVVYKKAQGIFAQEIVRESVEAAFGLEEIEGFRFVDAFLYKTHWNWADTLKELKENPFVKYAEPDKIIRLDRIPDDTRFNSQWALNNTGQNGGTPDADIDAPEAWDIATGRQSVIVAVIDSGVDYNHEDLKANMWTNPDEISGNGIDDDGNGIVDDYYGINAVDDTGDPMDVVNDPHGTHVAGIVGAAGNNGKGVAGVCWNCRIMALKFIGNDGTGSLSDELQCINYAVSHGAHIINGSYGDYGTSRIEESAIKRARDAGILCAFAAGNDGTDNDSDPHYPSSYDLDNIIAVADSTRKDQLDPGSNYGRISVDIAAPGSGILSTVPNNRYQSFSGTSMAAPFVAGLAALIKSYDFSLTYKEIKNRILSKGDPISSMAGKTLTGARINARKALDIHKIYSLTLLAGEGGIIDPSPGKHFYAEKTSVAVTAIPDTHFRFLLWTGDVPQDKTTQNPVLIFVDSEKSLQANFQRIIYPPAAVTGRKVLNRSLSQREYINVINWKANPDNVDIDRYKIYLMESGSQTLVAELNAQTFEYWDRNVEKEKTDRYKLVAVNSNLREGDPAYFDIH